MENAGALESYNYSTQTSLYNVKSLDCFFFFCLFLFIFFFILFLFILFRPYIYKFLLTVPLIMLYNKNLNASFSFMHKYYSPIIQHMFFSRNCLLKFFSFWEMLDAWKMFAIRNIVIMSKLFLKNLRYKHISITGSKQRGFLMKYFLTYKNNQFW